MPNFESTKRDLRVVLDQIVDGKIQLPDFQRGWIWDDEHIRSLLVSVGRSFPIGSIMLLETGGAARFHVRPIEGIKLNGNEHRIEHLILDGQQRLTSLTQVLRLPGPVGTRDSNKRPVKRFYYIDIEKALESDGNLEDAIVGVDGSRQLKANFGRDVVLDLSTTEMELVSLHFPCNQILNSDRWEQALYSYDSSEFARFMEFRSRILSRFRDYEIPVIELSKDNSKEAVCLVFEKVNTGGVALSVFELMTASYAADGFRLRDDWYGSVERRIEGRGRCLAQQALLKSIEPTDFLQGISLLHTYERQSADLAAGRTGKAVTAVSAKREQVLATPLSAYEQWADRLVSGFLSAASFLRSQGFHDLRFLPYRTQLVPLAVVMVHLGDRWHEPVIHDKLTRWYWSGVLGELYGGAIETRIALDVQDLMDWIHTPAAPEPATVVASGFQASRLDTLRTRGSAAYRGLYVLLQRQGARDFFWKSDISSLDQDDTQIDIHHIFPSRWCKAHGIPDRVFNSIVNKTPISAVANKMIGGQAPSRYLERLRTDPRVQISVAEQGAILRSHLIDPSLVRADDFAGFYQQRRASLLQLVESVLGKAVVPGDDDVAYAETDEEQRTDQ